MINYKVIIKNYLYIYGGGLLLLVIVNFFGVTYYGAQGWLSIFGLSLQPAELFKLCLIVFLSAFLGTKEEPTVVFWAGCYSDCALCSASIVTRFVQNDLGNAFSYVVILVGLLWIGNVKFSHALIGFMIAVAAFIGGTQAYVHYHDRSPNSCKDIGRAHWADRFDLGLCQIRPPEMSYGRRITQSWRLVLED